VDPTRKAPRIFLVLSSDRACERFLEHHLTLRLAFFLGVSSREDQHVLRGFFNIRSREQRKATSSLEQGCQEAREEREKSICSGAKQIEALIPRIQERDTTRDIKERLECNTIILLSFEQAFTNILALRHKVLTIWATAALELLTPLKNINIYLSPSEKCKLHERQLSGEWVLVSQKRHQ
jgi:hypothetical protein